MKSSRFKIAKSFKDADGHTALLVGVTRKKEAVYLALTLNGLDKYTMKESTFKKQYKEFAYPSEAAARLYAGYAMDLGASEEALDILTTLCEVSKKKRTTAIMVRNGAEIAKPGPKKKAVPKLKLGSLM